MKRLVITGSPGTGKTTVAEELGKRLKKPVIHLTEYIKKKKLYTGTHEGELVVDLKRLRKELSKEEDVIIEGHIACEVRLPDSIVIVLRAHPEELMKRISGRGYSKKKVLENAEAEALDYCTIRAIEEYGSKRVFQVDTTGKTVEEVVEECARIAEGKKRKKERVDFSDWILERA